MAERDPATEGRGPARKKFVGIVISTLSVLLSMLPASARAAQPLHIAAASNLTYVMPEIAAAFEKRYPDIPVRLSISATGNLYAQIRNGAPFDLFLSADDEHPRLLTGAGLTEAPPFRYALGRLVLWAPGRENFVEGIYALSSERFRKIALANPRHAPYGAAAQQVLEEAGLWEVLKERLIYGENISQTAQFVQSGSAQAGFIAESLLSNPAMAKGTAFPIPEGSYRPIVQQGVILKGEGKNGEAARLFRDFLLSAEGKSVLRRYGYGVE